MRHLSYHWRGSRIVAFVLLHKLHVLWRWKLYKSHKEYWRMHVYLHCHQEFHLPYPCLMLNAVTSRDDHVHVLLIRVHQLSAQQETVYERVWLQAVLSHFKSLPPVSTARHYLSGRLWWDQIRPEFKQPPPPSPSPPLTEAGGGGLLCWSC